MNDLITQFQTQIAHRPMPVTAGPETTPPPLPAPRVQINIRPGGGAVADAAL